MDHLYIRDLDDLAAAVAAYRALGIRAFIAPMLGTGARTQGTQGGCCAALPVRYGPALYTIC